MNTLRRLIRAIHGGPRFDVLPVGRDLRNADQQGQQRTREQARADAALESLWRRNVASNPKERARLARGTV